VSLKLFKKCGVLMKFVIMNIFIIVALF